MVMSWDSEIVIILTLVNRGHFTVGGDLHSTLLSIPTVADFYLLSYSWLVYKELGHFADKSQYE